jgi:hypothetical protein
MAIASWVAVGHVPMKSELTPYVVAGRIVAIVGMGFTAAAAILLFIIPEWLLGLAMLGGFAFFFGLIVAVEKYSSAHGLIGPE